MRVYMEIGDDGMCGEHKNRRTDYHWQAGVGVCRQQISIYKTYAPDRY